MRLRSLRRALCLTLPLAVAVAAPSSARAQTEDRALALDLFEQGRALVAHGDYKAAVAKFEAASKVMRTFGILLNLAECQEKLGRTASAWATWREARAVATEAHKSDDDSLAASRAKALEPTLARLTIVVPAAADLPDLEIRRDGMLVPRAAWGSGTPVDPGSHVLEERASGRKPRTTEVRVEANALSAIATMTVLDPDVPAASVSTPIPLGPAPEVTPLAARPETSNTGSSQRIAGWVVGGAGLAAAGAGIAVALSGQSKHNDAVAAALAGNSSLAQSEESSANGTKTAGYVTIGVGGALAATGVILLILAPSRTPSQPSHIAFQPWISPIGAGAGFSTDW